jgi:hypothetical protein
MTFPVAFGQELQRKSSDVQHSGGFQATRLPCGPGRNALDMDPASECSPDWLAQTIYPCIVYMLETYLSFAAAVVFLMIISTHRKFFPLYNYYTIERETQYD